MTARSPSKAGMENDNLSARFNSRIPETTYHLIMTRLIRQAFTAALFISTPSWVFCQETPPKALPASGPPAIRLPYQYLSQAGHVTSSVPLGEAPPEGVAHLNRAQQGLSGTKIYGIGRAAGMAYDVPRS